LVIVRGCGHAGIINTLAGNAIDELDGCGNRIMDETPLILLSTHYEPIPFIFPAHRLKMDRELALDSRAAMGRRRHRVMRGVKPMI
jgi:hypothetical protein